MSALGHTQQSADQLWDYLLESGIASEETLQVVSNINGYSVETMESILYAVTGYRSFDQLRDAEDDDA